MSDKAGISKKTANVIPGIPFEKGQSGNPSGRPKMPEHIKKLFQGPLTKLSLEVLQDVLDGTDTTAKTGDRIKAAEIVLDRAFGKAAQAVNMEDENGNTIIPNITVTFVKPE